MKSKKLIIAVVALTMSATSALAFSACHKHEYNWEVTRAATCTTEGEKTGTCDCGDTKKEVIEVIAHSYGEWVITKPTETAAGQAVKSCATDSEHAHDIEVELPELGDEAYTVTEGDDVDTYTLANTNGEITFTVEKVKDIVVKVTVSEDDLIADGEDEENDDDDDGDILNGDVFGFNGTATGCECVEKARDYFSRRRELYSDDFCNVIETTFEIAQDSNHGYISPEHLVYAMLNCDCGARGLLVAAGADAQTYGEQFFYVYDKRLWTVGFTPRTRLLMDRAFLLAQDIGGVDAKPRSEHLLLVTLMQQSCLAVKILKLLGVDMDKLSDGLDKALKNPDE